MYILKPLFFSISVNSGFGKLSRLGKYLATIHLDFQELLLIVSVQQRAK